MEIMRAMLQSLPSLVLTVAIQYRLPCRVLARRYSGLFTFSTLLTVQFFAGWLNLSLHFAKDIGENTLYFGIFLLASYLLLFKGSSIKKVFLTVLISCGLPITFYISLPLIQSFFYQTKAHYLLALKIAELVHLLFCAVGLELVGKKFLNLRRELPFGYTVYLTAVILFLFVAVYSANDRMLIISRAVVSLPSALTIATFALAGTILMVVAIFAVDRQVQISLQEQLYLMQAAGLKSRELEWRRISSFRHDIKNHLICLSGLLESGKNEQATAYMRNLTDTVQQLDSPVQTGNDYADALLSVKYAEAMAAKISVTIEMAIPPQGYLDPVDLCCILSNAFDNAIAACNRLPEGEKWIIARAFIRQGQFVLVIKNSTPPNVIVTNGEVFPKEVTADHGLGLDTVKEVVRKYDGVLTLSAEDAFSFSVLLPPLRL